MVKGAGARVACPVAQDILNRLAMQYVCVCGAEAEAKRATSEPREGCCGGGGRRVAARLGDAEMPRCRSPRRATKRASKHPGLLGAPGTTHKHNLDWPPPPAWPIPSPSSPTRTAPLARRRWRATGVDASTSSATEHRRPVGAASSTGLPAPTPPPAVA